LQENLCSESDYFQVPKVKKFDAALLIFLLQSTKIKKNNAVLWWRKMSEANLPAPKYQSQKTNMYYFDAGRFAKQI